MNRLFSQRFALVTMMVIFSLIIIFHLLVMSDLIPYEMVWGGRLKTREEMIRFEIISIIAIGLMLLVVLIKGKLINTALPSMVIRVALWLMAVLFLLNTIGNLLSNNALEKALFTPLTILLFFCSLRLAIDKKSTANATASRLGQGY